jgi:hypothetical protein
MILILMKRKTKTVIPLLSTLRFQILPTTIPSTMAMLTQITAIRLLLLPIIQHEFNQTIPFLYQDILATTGADAFKTPTTLQPAHPITPLNVMHT